uniref:Uncharacterized protein n=1 Tax=uncultured Chloroflexi bacterium HF0200_09I09 TaxID=710736 RepID=E0XU78_9CHLR|nr:hypothetical protein [uncultured Chloroflexi bacterium HF0200_09I09]
MRMWSVISTPYNLRRRGRVIWWSRGDSNPRLPPCKGGALPAELRPHLVLDRRPASGGPSWTRTRDLSLIRTAL